MLDGFGLIVFHHDRDITLGMDIEFLLSLLIFKADLVEVWGAASFARAALDATLGLVGREFVGGHLLGVIDTAGDDRPVGVALQKIDDHFLANAGDMDTAPVFSS